MQIPMFFAKAMRDPFLNSERDGLEQTVRFPSSNGKETSSPQGEEKSSSLASSSLKEVGNILGRPRPATGEKAAKSRQVFADDQAKASGLEVAIVEDDVNLCNLYKLILARNGHKATIVAHSGGEIKKAIEENKLQKIDFAIVDYRLDDAMNGLDVARLILESNPRIRIVIASAEDSITKQVEAAGFKLLRKPFSVENLLRCFPRILQVY
jgi:CheY-like chemotaxis protein